MLKTEVESWTKKVGLSSGLKNPKIPKTAQRVSTARASTGRNQSTPLAGLMQIRWKHGAECHAEISQS